MMSSNLVRCRVVGVSLLLGQTLAAFGAITLEECVVRALESSPDLAAAEARVEAARAQIRAAESAYYPSLSLGANYTATDNPVMAFMSVLNQRRLTFEDDFNDPDTTENANAQVGATWRLYDGGQRSQGRRAARMREELRCGEADAARNELVYQVHRAYFGVLQAREFVHIQQAAVESLETSSRIARDRLEAGAVVRTDVLNIEVRLAEAREALARARNRETLARSALGNVVGVPELCEATFPEDEPDSSVRDIDVGQFTIDERPELRAAEAGVLAVQARLAGVRASYLPSLDAMGHADWDAEPFHGFEDSWFAGLSAQWEFFDGRRRRSEVEAADAQVAVAREEARRVRLNLGHQLREAVSTYREAVERIGVTAKSAELADESLRMTQERYRNGAADITELLAAEAAATSARSRSAAARYDREIAIAGLRHAAGGFQ